MIEDPEGGHPRFEDSLHRGFKTPPHPVRCPAVGAACVRESVVRPECDPARSGFTREPRPFDVTLVPPQGQCTVAFGFLPDGRLRRYSRAGRDEMKPFVRRQGLAHRTVFYNKPTCTVPSKHSPTIRPRQAQKIGIPHVCPGRTPGPGIQSLSHNLL